MDEKTLLSNYFLATEEALDLEDVDVLMSDYSYDEDVDEESEIKKKKVSKEKKRLEKPNDSLTSKRKATSSHLSQVRLIFPKSRKRKSMKQPNI